MTIQNAVIRQAGGRENVRTAYEGGADCGVPGFIYYTDTVKFWKRHKAAILALAEGMADDLGEGLLEMVAGFGCLKDQHLTTSEVGQVLYGRASNDDTYTSVANAMAWFALETVARDIFDR